MNVPGTNFVKRGVAIICAYTMLAPTLPAQSATPAATTATQAANAQTISPQTGVPVRFEMPKSHNPINAYSPNYVPEPVLELPAS